MLVGFVRKGSAQPPREDQETAIRELSTREKLGDPKVYSYDGPDGAAWPIFDEMLANLREGGENATLVIASLAVLGEGVSSQEVRLQTVLETGARVISVAEPDLGENDPARAVLRRAIRGEDEFAFPRFS